MKATVALGLVTVALLALSVAWWLADPGFEPVITGVAALAGLVSAGVAAGRRESADPVDRAASPSAAPRPRLSTDRRPLPSAVGSHTVGREGVVDALQHALDAVGEDRRGMMICVTGEPGIGKTTVAESFLAELSAEDVTIARGRCSERLAGAEAYLPLLEALESLLRGPDGRAVTERMIGTAPSWYRQLEPRYETDPDDGAAGATSQERLKRELALLLEQLGRDRPLVIFLEDLHWADVSTVDALRYVADRFDRIGALVLATYRPEDMRLDDHVFLQVKPTLEQRHLLKELPLRFLTVEDVRRYLALEFDGESLPEGLAELIHEKTEGSPLFMADLVRDLRRRGVVAELGGRWTLTETLDSIGRELPESIRSMIGRKIEQLGPAERSALLAAAVQGEAFDAAVVARALELDVVELEERLEAVARVHAMIGRVGEHEFPDGTVTLRYRFIHVLYQNALYDSLTPAKRVSLSLAVAGALEALHREDTAPVALELALLHEAGRESEPAAKFFLEAARQESRVFANHEAAHLARRGIGILAALPETPERSRTELAFRTILAPAVMAISGWASEEAADNNRRLEELSRRVGGDREVFATLCGSMAFHMVKADPERARPLGEECVGLATRLEDPALELTANAAFGDALFLLGELGRARHHQELALELWRGREWESLPTFYAQHPVTTALGSGAWTSMWLGFPDRALEQAREAVDVVAGLGHPFSIPFAYDYLAHVYEFRGELSEAEDAIDRMEAADESGAPYFLFETLALRGRMLARRGSLEDGLERLHEALALSDAGGFLIFRTRTLVWIAEALAEAERVERGIELLDEGLSLVADGGVRTFHAELHRAKGDLLRLAASAPAVTGDAEPSYRAALEVADRQEARGFELRAAVGLARLLRDQGRDGEARQVLEPVYGRFTEGLETTDLREARGLLEGMGAGRSP